MNSSSLIPIDLIQEILSRLPSKSVARFRCVSKQWGSMLSSPYLKELFLTKSSAKPRLLFSIEEDGFWSFFSSPQHQNPYEKSLVVAAEFHVKFFPANNIRICHRYDLKYFSCGYASGLIYLYGNRYQGRPLICNTNTGRYATLPYLSSYGKSYSFFGFDPIDKQYKALFMAYPSGPGHCKILTLGTSDMMKWRKIKCSLRHDIKSEGVCINGVLYYLGDTTGCVHMNEGHEVTSDYVIICFDVRSEKFTFIEVERFCRLINYKGKLAVIYWEDDIDIYELYYSEEIDVDKYVEDNVEADAINELRVWVLEDVEKHEWSKYAYTWTDDNFFRRHVSNAGVTASGEIVFSMRKYTPKQPFYVFYFNPERNTLRRVEIQVFGEMVKKICRVCTFVDHVEDLKVNDLKVLKSVHPPLAKLGYVELDSELD